MLMTIAFAGCQDTNPSMTIISIKFEYSIQKVFQRNRVCWYQLVDNNGKKYPKNKYYQQLNLVA